MTTDDERDLLLAHLAAQRRHVLSSVDGLDDVALRLAVLPSCWTFLGMISHLTVDDERFWFQAVVAGDPAAIAFFDAGPDGWTVGQDQDPQQVLATYRSEIERSDAIIRATDLDAPPRWWPVDLFGGWRLDSLREVLLHLIVEVACHAGHLDAGRELVDGRQWLVVDQGRAAR